MTRRHLLATALALAAVVVALHARTLFRGMTFGLRDHLILDLPIRTFLHASLWAGHIPQWWDAVGLGLPFAASPVHQAWAPVTALCALLPMPFGADVEPTAYLFVASLGTALLSSELGADGVGAFLAGTIAATSGYLGSMALNGNLPYVAWLPWLAWAAVRLVDAVRAGRPALGRAAVFSVAVALQIFGGEPATVVTAALLVVAVTAVRGWSWRVLAWLGGAGACGVALAAVQLVPAALLVSSTSRGGGFDLATGSEWPLHPVRLLELVWPRLLGDPIHAGANLARLLPMRDLEGHDPTWSFSVFVGAPALVLAFAGARNRLRWLLVAIAAFLVLALGTYTPVFEVLRAIFPPERYARFPEKHLVGALVLVAALAGAGLRRVRGEPGPWRFALAAGALLLGAGAVALVASRGALVDSLRLRAAGAGVAGLSAEDALRISSRWAAAASMAAALSWVGALLAARGRQIIGTAALLVAFAAPAVANTLAFTMVVPRREIADAPALLRVPTEEGGIPARLYRPCMISASARDPEEYAHLSFETAALNTASRFGFDALPGFDVALERDWSWCGEEPVRLPWQGAALLGVRYLVVDDFEMLPPFPGPVLARAHRLNLVDLAQRARPRAFVTSRWVAASSRDQAIRLLMEPGRDPAMIAVEPAGGEAVFPPPAETPATPCLIQRRSPEDIELSCYANRDGWVVLLDGDAPGWGATVDGVRTEVSRADGYFRAVPVRSGAHRIRFTYSAPGFAAGAAISTLALAAVLAAAVWSRVRRRTG